MKKLVVLAATGLMFGGWSAGAQENARRDIQTDLGPSVASHLIRQLPIVVAKRLRRGRSVSLQGQERANWPS